MNLYCKVKNIASRIFFNKLDMKDLFVEVLRKQDLDWQDDGYYYRAEFPQSDGSIFKLRIGLDHEEGILFNDDIITIGLTKCRGETSYSDDVSRYNSWRAFRFYEEIKKQIKDKSESKERSCYEELINSIVNTNRQGKQNDSKQ